MGILGTQGFWADLYWNSSELVSFVACLTTTAMVVFRSTFTGHLLEAILQDQFSQNRQTETSCRPSARVTRFPRSPTEWLRLVWVATHFPSTERGPDYFWPSELSVMDMAVNRALGQTELHSNFTQRPTIRDVFFYSPSLAVKANRATAVL
jgi:hypothetical protein